MLQLFIDHSFKISGVSKEHCILPGRKRVIAFKHAYSVASTCNSLHRAIISCNSRSCVIINVVFSACCASRLQPLAVNKEAKKEKKNHVNRNGTQQDFACRYFNYCFFGGALSETNMESTTRVQILDETVCVSLRPNALGKGKNPSISPLLQAMCLIVGQAVLFNPG